MDRFYPTSCPLLKESVRPHPGLKTHDEHYGLHHDCYSLKWISSPFLCSEVLEILAENTRPIQMIILEMSFCNDRYLCNCRILSLSTANLFHNFQYEVKSQA